VEISENLTAVHEKRKAEIRIMDHMVLRVLFGVSILQLLNFGLKNPERSSLSPESLKIRAKIVF
jgi:hypothetical protein